MVMWAITLTPGHVSGVFSPWPRKLVLVLDLAQVFILLALELELKNAT